MENLKSAIIGCMQSWNSDRFDKIWMGYNTLEDETGYKKKELQKGMKELSKENKVELLYTSSDNSRVAGSGWFLT